MKIIITILLIIIGLEGYAQDLDKILNKFNNHSIPYITCSELNELHVQETVWILDVREWEEYEVSHIPNAHFVGFKQFSKEKVQDLLPSKEISIIVYCSIGVRSEKIGEQLKSLGYLHVRNLYGGIFEWVNDGLPLENSSGEETESIHAFSKEWRHYLHKGQKVY